MSVLLASAEKASERVGQIKTKLRSVGGSIVGTYLYVYHSFWRHPYLTPEEMFAEVGTDAVEIFSFVGIVEALYPERVLPIPEGWTLTPNEDGSITPTYTDASSSSSSDSSTSTSTSTSSVSSEEVS